MNGEPAAAIVAIAPPEREGEDYQVTPLFVSVTDAMVLTAHDATAACKLSAWVASDDEATRFAIMVSGDPYQL